MTILSLFLTHLLLLVDLILYFSDKSLKLLQSLFGKILRWRSVLSHTLEISYSCLSILLLLVNYAFELVKLPIALFNYFFFETFLVEHMSLHVWTLLEGFVSDLENILKFLNLFSGSFLYGGSLVFVSLFEETLIAKGQIVRCWTVDREFVFVRASLYLTKFFDHD